MPSEMDGETLHMKVILLGASGQLGQELARQLDSQDHLSVLSPSDLNITDHQAVAHTLVKLEPDVIINAAAFTAVDEAEREKNIAYAINSDAVANIAQLANDMNAWLIHYSTDYVFDGTKPSSYLERDETNPINTYGASKLAGDKHIQAHTRNHLIFRTTWIIGSDGNNFAKTILRLASEREQLSVINDQRGVPTSPSLIAHVTIDALKAIENKTAWPAGIYNLTPQGSTTWYEIAQVLIHKANQYGLDLATNPENVHAVTTDEYPTVARRPLNSQLNTDKLEEYLSFALPYWHDDFMDVATNIIHQQKKL